MELSQFVHIHCWGCHVTLPAWRTLP